MFKSVESIFSELKDLALPAYTGEHAAPRLNLDQLMEIATLIYGFSLHSADLFKKIHTQIQRDEWHDIDALTMAGWTQLRDTFIYPALELFKQVEWFELLDHADERIIEWLTDDEQRMRVQGLLKHVEGNADQLIERAITIIFTQDSDHTPAAFRWFDEHQHQIQHWISFLIEKTSSSP